MPADPQITHDKVMHLHDRAVRQLVELHAKNRDEPLLMAVRHRQTDPIDVHLFEVLAEFPGGGEDEPFTTEFEPSANLRILGKLQLTLCNARQFRAMLARGGELVDELKKGDVLHREGEGEELARELRLA